MLDYNWHPYFLTLFFKHEKYVAQYVESDTTLGILVKNFMVFFTEYLNQKLNSREKTDLNLSGEVSSNIRLFILTTVFGNFFGTS